MRTNTSASQARASTSSSFGVTLGANPGFSFSSASATKLGITASVVGSGTITLTGAGANTSVLATLSRDPAGRQIVTVDTHDGFSIDISASDFTALANVATSASSFLTALTTPVPDSVSAAGPSAITTSRILIATGMDTSGVDPDPATAAVKISEQADSWKTVVATYGSLDAVPVPIADAIASGEPIAQGADGQLTSSEPGCGGGTGAAMCPIPIAAPAGGATLGAEAAATVAATPWAMLGLSVAAILAMTSTPTASDDGIGTKVPTIVVAQSQGGDTPSQRSPNSDPNNPDQNFDAPPPPTCVGCVVAATVVAGAYAVSVVGNPGLPPPILAPVDPDNQADPVSVDPATPGAVPASDGYFYANQAQADHADDAFHDRQTETTDAKIALAVKGSKYSAEDYNAYLAAKETAGLPARSPEDYVAFRTQMDQANTAHTTEVAKQITDLQTQFPNATIIQTPSVRSANGETLSYPDIMVVDPATGSAKFIEVKTGDGRLTDQQKIVNADINNGTAVLTAAQSRELGLPAGTSVKDAFPGGITTEVRYGPSYKGN
jgi:hypothetical protein